jgi:acetoin utilization protein AcuB
MTKYPVTVTPEDSLAAAQAKMTWGGFHRVPVVAEGKLVGIVSDRDVRPHWGKLDDTSVGAVMTREPKTVTPQTTIEDAARLLIERKIGGLPVLDEGRLVGIVTITDMMQAFLDVMGAMVKGAARIDLLLTEGGADLPGAAKIIAQEGGEILGLGTYRERWGESPVCYLRMRYVDPDRLAELLKAKGYNVLGVHH